MDKKITAILMVKLGHPIKEVADKYGIKATTLKRWCDNYIEPSNDVIHALIKENVTAMLITGVDRGGDLTGIVNALKLVDDGSNINILDTLLELGSDDE